jgi:hypothetical protein
MRAPTGTETPARPQDGRAAAGLGSSARRQVNRFARAGLVVLRDPVEGVERVREKLANESEKWTSHGPVTSDPDWESSLHASLHVDWPCEGAETFQTLWAEIVSSMQARGLEVGRGTFSGWDDADPALARAAWCLACHTKPTTVVETGVARGLTTRVMLEALEANGAGRLFSIDLAPPLDDDRLAVETGAAVTDALKGRWTFVEGSSRRRLPRLLRELGTIDLFIHDSRHTRRNIVFELEEAWPAVRPGGFLLADDIHGNSGFQDAVRAFGGPPSIVCASDDGQGMFGVIRKPE